MFRPYKPEPFFTGDQILYIQGYGERHLPIDHGYDPKALFHLCEIAYIPNFITNVVFYKRLKATSYRLNNERNIIIQDNGDIFCIYEIYSQTIIHYKAVTPVTFPATTAITTNTTTTATIAITAITTTIATTVITAITAISLPTDPSTVITSVTTPSTAVFISSRKPLKNKLTDGMI